MNKLLYLLPVLFLSFSCGDGENKNEEKQDDLKLETLEERVSYAIGLNSASEIKNVLATNQMEEKLALKDIQGGMIDVFNQAELKYTESETGEIIRTYLAGQAQDKKADAGYCVGMVEALGMKKSLESRGVYNNMVTNILTRGLADGFNNVEKPLLSLDESRQIITDYFSDVLKKMGNEFLAENKLREEVMETESGLQYEVLRPGTSDKKPTLESEVTVHYVGTLINGNIFDSSYERNEPTTFPLSRVIAGWQEGIQLMSVGSKYKFYIPEYLAYGAAPPQGSIINPFATLIFEVELISFK